MSEQEQAESIAASFSAQEKRRTRSSMPPRGPCYICDAQSGAYDTGAAAGFKLEMHQESAFVRDAFVDNHQRRE